LKQKNQDIVFLNWWEQEAIKAPLLRETLINARKWLLGCLIGQEGGCEYYGKEYQRDINGIKIIELKQQKRVNWLQFLHLAIEIIENGFPIKYH
jgi:hypothetical protein